jgi:hypothetical protein
VKVEHVGIHQSVLEDEYNIYKELGGSQHIPNVHWFGTELDHYALVIDLLGLSLEELFRQHDSVFNLKTVLLLAIQMVSFFVLIRSLIDGLADFCS